MILMRVRDEIRNAIGPPNVAICRRRRERSGPGPGAYRPSVGAYGIAIHLRMVTPSPMDPGLSESVLFSVSWQIALLICEALHKRSGKQVVRGKSRARLA